MVAGQQMERPQPDNGEALLTLDDYGLIFIGSICGDDQIIKLTAYC